MALLPSSPRGRRVIYVVDQFNLDRLSYSSDVGELYRPDVALLKWPVDAEDELAVELDDARLVTPGVILVQSPFDASVYLDLSNASDTIALQKAALFCHLCQLLGAKDVRIASVNKVEEKAGAKGAAGGGRGPVKITADAALEGEVKFASALTWHDRYPMAEGNIEGARELLRSRNLVQDVVLRNFVDARALPNRLAFRKLTLSLDREARATLEMAANLKIPASIHGIASAQRSSASSFRYSIDYEVTFW